MSAADGLDLSNTAVAEVDDDGSGATSRSNVAAAAAAAGSTPGNTGGATDKKQQRNTGGAAAAKAGRRWIKELKTGDKVIGYVAETTKFAAFVDCSVVRQGSKVGVLPGDEQPVRVLSRLTCLSRCYEYLFLPLT